MNLRSLGEMINEIICDNILRKFEGNKCIAREQLRERSFYENLDPDYSVVEEHINFLISDKTLKVNGSAISLTTKGWFILTNTDKVGYVAQKIEIAEREMNERETRMVFRWATIIATVSLAAWLLYKLVFVAA